MKNTEEIIEKLRELRRQAGYEPNAWYEQKEEEILTSTITDIQREMVEKVENTRDNLLGEWSSVQSHHYPAEYAELNNQFDELIESINSDCEDVANLSDKTE